MKIKILSSAYNDISAGRDFYENLGNGLGDYFLDLLFSDIDSLVLNGGIHLKIYGYYRLLSKRFPYAVYYKIDEECDGDKSIIIWRVLDCRQNPKKTELSLPSAD